RRRVHAPGCEKNGGGNEGADHARILREASPPALALDAALRRRDSVAPRPSRSVSRRERGRTEAGETEQERVPSPASRLRVTIHVSVDDSLTPSLAVATIAYSPRASGVIDVVAPDSAESSAPESSGRLSTRHVIATASP